MKFTRPVDERFPVLHHYLEWGSAWGWYVDPQSSLWIPKGSDLTAKGQHCGVDFDCPKGTVVSAMADGMVVKARHESALDYHVGAGLHIIQIVTMPGHDAWWIKYCHLNMLYVEIGQKIQRGQPLGESGRTGDADHPFLHVDLMDTKRQWREIAWR